MEKNPAGVGEVMNLREKARAVLYGFRAEESRDGSKLVVTTTTEPARELARAVHAELGMSLPDDWTYRAIWEALEALADGVEPEEWEPEPDVYTSHLLEWLRQCPVAMEYCDHVLTELAPKTMFEVLAQAQVEMYRDVMAAVMRALETMEDEN